MDETKHGPRVTMTPEKIAENAIGLFLEYRDKHGNTEESAQMNACFEVVEGTEDFVVVDKKSYASNQAQIAALREALETLEQLASYYEMPNTTLLSAALGKARAALALGKGE